MRQSVHERTIPRLGDAWDGRVIEPSSFTLGSSHGSNKRLLRQLSFGTALATATSDLLLETKRLKVLQSALLAELESGKSAQALASVVSLGEGLESLTARYQDLENFASGAPVKTKPLSIREILKMIARKGTLFCHDVTFTAETVLSEGNIKVNHRHFQMVLTHLVKNAVCAVNEKASALGRSIQVHVHPLIRLSDSGFLGPNGQDRQCLGISIYDTGAGMSPKVLARAGDPYFTSWQRLGQGTGLGLFISGNLVEANGGSLLLKSKEQEGTLATLCFPFMA